MTAEPAVGVVDSPPPGSAADFPGPVNAGERVADLDVLRGVALFGVFLMNMEGYASDGLMATEQQLLTLPTAALDHTLAAVLGWLVLDKANTLFAFLFGLGFYLQMQRLGARGANFERIYRRRLTILLLLGLVHTVFIFGWDILHLYAIAGFMLFALRKASDRTLLAGGLLLAMFGRSAQEWPVQLAGLKDWHGLPSPYGEEAVLLRQQYSLDGDYAGLVRAFADYNLVDYLLTGVLIGWLAYALGRFMIGAWVGRRGWLQDAHRFLPGFRRAMRIALPAGLFLGGSAHILAYYGETARLPAWGYWELIDSTLHLLSVPVLAAGYLCAIVVGLHTRAGARLLAPFASIGRTALTNYVAQSFIIAFVLFGVGPGLALAGRIGTTAVTLIVICGFAAQMLLSTWWLARFRYGPLEWLWRALTYGRRPPMKLVSAGPATDPT